MRKFLVLTLALLITVLAAGGALAASTVSDSYPNFTWGEADLTGLSVDSTDVVPQGNLTWHTSDDIRGMLASLDVVMSDEELVACWGFAASEDISGTQIVMTMSPDVVSTIPDDLAAHIVQSDGSAFTNTAKAPAITKTANTVAFTTASDCEFKNLGTYTPEYFIFFIKGGSTPGPEPKPEPTPSGGSSGGCSAGFGGLALLALPFLLRRKR